MKRGHLRFYAVLAVALVLGSCSAEAPKSEFVPIAEIAPELVTIAQKQLPDVKFESARKIKVRGQDVFEIRGKQPNGKIREVEVAVNGEVLEIE